MNVELTPDAARWVETEMASGTFASPAEVVQRAVDQLRLAALRGKLDAAIAEGGRNSSEDALRFVRERLNRSASASGGD